MPRWDWKCPKDGTTVEHIEPSLEDAQKALIFCSCGAKMERQHSIPSFRFKGSGFYETDYKRTSPPKDEEK